MADLPQSPDPFDWSLARRMEARLRREFEAAESEAALLAARRRRLADVAWEAAQAGRQVTVRVGSRHVVGKPLYARNDLMSLETANGRVDVCLPNIDAMSVAPAPGHGVSVRKDVESFAARISMLQLTSERVEVVCRGGEARFYGTIEYVARDHVALAGSRGEVLVALDAIAYVVPRPELR